MLDFEWGSEAEDAERKAGHRLKRMGEDVLLQQQRIF
jgi:hypothetical protein